MHQYQTDENIKTNFLLVAVLISIILAYCFNNGVQYFNLQIPWYVETPSILGIFGLIYWLYNKYLWKNKLTQKLDWVKIPNISGNWLVEIKTSHDGFTKTVFGKAIIRQTAFKISIAVETDNSTSQSIHAAVLRTEKINEYDLTYNYINHPRADSVESMNIHIGTTSMSIADNGLRMDGQYYTGRDRRNFGRIIFTRQ